ncbi:MAG: neutral/alkaline non-lysosomal ceramidase N-terminal domain-containing protein [Clostridia bacterium]|nr:neutral/alkaline non-lysosomal ceramidase N-terminal domain-containing protein [Clostridia bacterium]
MNFDAIATKAVNALARHEGKKLLKKNGPSKPFEPVQPTVMKNKVDDKFRCGFSSKITMPVDIKAKEYILAGHKTGKTVEGVLDPLTVSAVWLDCKDNGGIVIIGADIVGLAGMEINEIRNRLSDFSRKTGCKSINICCTHNHAGIDTLGYWGKALVGPIPSNGKDPEYMEILFNNIVKCCEEAYENRKEGTLSVGTKHIEDAVYRRRQPLYARDVMTRIRFTPDDGSEETWIINFGAHPNTMGGSNRLVSAEYPGYLRAKINETKKTNVLFGIGAIAAVDPGMYSEDNYERARIEGEKLAEAALSIDNDVALSADITVLRQPYYAPIENGVLALMGIIKTVNYDRAHCADSSLGVALKTEMTYIRIGSLEILLLPGEAAPEFVFGNYSSAEESATGMGPEVNAKPLVEVAGNENLVVFGVSNDMTGYMIPLNDFVLNEEAPYMSNGKDRFGNGHYHETNSLGINTTQVVSDVFAGIIERVKG